MIKLQKSTNKEQQQEYYDLLTSDRRYGSLKNVYTKYFQKSFEEIVLMEPDKLQEFVRKFDSLDANSRKTIREEFMHVTKNGKKSCYIIDVLYKTMPQSAKNIIYKIANSKTCPYCNRNFVNMVEVQNAGITYSYKSTFELDHFYNKSDYPMLAVSLYNLIPVCPSCNRIKGKKMFTYYPYATDISFDAKFSFDILNSKLNKEEDINLKFKYANDREQEQAQSLYLQELYENHKDIALEIIQKARFQGMGYMESLTTQLQDLFPDKEEVYKLIYGNYLGKNDWAKRPLSKFTYDIAKEVLQMYGIDIDINYR